MRIPEVKTGHQKDVVSSRHRQPIFADVVAEMIEKLASQNITVFPKTYYLRVGSSELVQPKGNVSVENLTEFTTSDEKIFRQYDLSSTPDIYRFIEEVTNPYNDNVKGTPLYWAIKRNYPALVKIFIPYFIKKSKWTDEVNDMKSAIIFAVKQCYVDVITMLIEDQSSFLRYLFGIDVRGNGFIVGFKGFVLYTVLQHHKFPISQRLISIFFDKKLELTERSLNLELIILYARLDILENILFREIPLDYRLPSFVMTALQFAVFLNLQKITLALLRGGANPNTEGKDIPTTLAYVALYSLVKVR